MRILSLALSLLFSTVLLAQDGNVTRTLADARDAYDDGNLRGALTILREAQKAAPNDPRVLVWMARVHADLGRDDLAIEYLDNAAKGDAAVPQREALLHGRVLQRLGRYEEAIAAYTTAANTGRPTDEDAEAIRRGTLECRRAWADEERRLPIPIAHLGPEVNSRFDEAAPVWSPAGDAIVFTSRRDGGLNDAIDEAGDFRFFSDIYTARRRKDGSWERAQLLPGAINTKGHDAALAWPGGRDSLLVYLNNEVLAGDICVSRRGTDGQWSAAEPLPRPVNSSYFEGSATVSGDGKFLYFVSERPTGIGRGDLYVSTLLKGGGWSKPEAIGTTVNTPGDEKFVQTNADGTILFFASDGLPGYGNYDLFRTERVNGVWSVPLNLGLPVNSPREESTFSLTSDGTQLLLSSELPTGFGDRDLYIADVSAHPHLGARAFAPVAGTLTVSVTSDGKPASGALVELLDGSGLAVLASGTTGDDGTFRIPVHAGTDFTLRAQLRSRKGSTTFRREFPATPGTWAETVKVGLE